MKAKRNLLALLLSVVMLWQGFSIVHAENGSAAVENSVAGGKAETPAMNPMGATSGEEVTGTITNVKFTLNGGNVTDQTEIYSHTEFVLNADLVIKEKTINKGDYSILQLPKELMAKTEDVAITNAAGQVMANAHYDSASKQFTFVFTEHAAGNSASNGKFTFVVKADSSQISSKGNVPIEIKLGNEKIFNGNINYQGVKRGSEPDFWKNVRRVEEYKDADDRVHYFIHYYIILNGRKLAKSGTAPTVFNNLVLRDELVSEALHFVKPNDENSGINWKSEEDKKKFKPFMYKGTWRSGTKDRAGVFHPAIDDTDANGGPDWAVVDAQDNSKGAALVYLEEPALQFDGNRKFSYTVGDLQYNDGLELHYFAEIDEVPRNGMVYKNNIFAKADQLEEKKIERSYTIQWASGHMDGVGYTIEVKKVNEKGEALQGAEFQITNEKSGRSITVTTDENGIAKWDNVLLSEYKIKEINPPEGYVLGEKTEETVTVEELKATADKGAKITKTFENKKKPEDPKPEDPKPETRNVTVDKKWIQGNSTAQKPKKVKVYLVENGVKTNKVEELSEENGWKASFSNLPKKDDSGAEIRYTVSEEQVQDYNPAISGTQDTGFTITNYTGDRVAIPVTKI